MKKRWVGRKGGTRNLNLSKDTMKRNLLKRGKMAIFSHSDFRLKWGVLNRQS